MEKYLRGITRGGKEWIPHFISALDKERCIGCGRCYKVCGFNVLTLNMPNEDDGDENSDRFMVIENQDNCIGCEACGRVCQKKCYTYAPAKLN